MSDRFIVEFDFEAVYLCDGIEEWYDWSTASWGYMSLSNERDEYNTYGRELLEALFQKITEDFADDVTVDISDITEDDKFIVEVTVRIDLDPDVGHGPTDADNKLSTLIDGVTGADGFGRCVSLVTNIGEFGLTDHSLWQINPFRLNASHNTRVTNVSVCEMSNLTSLNIAFNNSVTDMSLRRLPNLTSLDITGSNSVTDDSLSQLTNLTNLDITGAANITVEPLILLENLEELRFGAGTTCPPLHVIKSNRPLFMEAIETIIREHQSLESFISWLPPCLLSYLGRWVKAAFFQSRR